MKLTLYYLISINIITLVAMAIDKNKARKDKYRIKEKTLLLLILLGGFIGSFLAMIKIRHKNKKKKFIITTILSGLLWYFLITKI